jgi:hypothetical protein
VTVAIYYYCPRSEKPAGGVKQIYRHVEALADAGIEAYVLTESLRKVQGWFESTAPMALIENAAWIRMSRRLLSGSVPLAWLDRREGLSVRCVGRDGRTASRVLGSADVVVLPEYFGRSLRPPAFGSRLVIFNQNAHYTFTGMDIDDDVRSLAYFGNLLGVLVVSTHNLDYISHAFPSTRVLHSPNGINEALFRPGAKKRQIAYMPRKLKRDLVQVFQILQARGCLEGWQLCPIDGMAETQVARTLSESLIFASSCESEGFGLPPLEAAFAACTVVGYTGYAAREFMTPDACFPVEQGDILGFARALERVMSAYVSGADPVHGDLQARALAHSQTVRRLYSTQQEAQGVVDAWASLLRNGG